MALPAPAMSAEPLTLPVADNDNIRPAGKHEWPCRDRLAAAKLMRTPAANAQALRALYRFRRDLDAMAGTDYWQSFGADAAINEDVRGAFQADLHFEFATAEHLMALYDRGDLEYREYGGMPLAAHKRDGAKLYVLDDRARGERGPAKPKHPAAVQAELDRRYAGAAWPSDATVPADIFMGAQMRRVHEPRATASPEDRLLHAAMAHRVDAFQRGAMSKALYKVLVDAASGATSEEIGESRGHAGKYASAVGTELQRIALEGLIEAYADYDGDAT